MSSAPKIARWLAAVAMLAASSGCSAATEGVTEGVAQRDSRPQRADAEPQRSSVAAGVVRLRRRVERIAPDLSIADLGITAGRRLVGVVSDFSYTPVGGGRVAPAQAWVAANIVTAVVPILGSVTCNKVLVPQLRAALAEVQVRGLADQIHPDEYAGCYYPRYIAGTTELSNHAFGLALDLNVPGNQRGTVGQMHPEVVAIFKRWGFAWGGDWGYTDPMHFELERVVSAG